MANIKMMVDKQYKNGQTDGMKLFKKKTKKGSSYTFAANIEDAATRFKGNITIDHNKVREYLNQVNLNE